MTLPPDDGRLTPGIWVRIGPDRWGLIVRKAGDVVVVVDVAGHKPKTRRSPRPLLVWGQVADLLWLPDDCKHWCLPRWRENHYGQRTPVAWGDIYAQAQTLLDSAMDALPISWI